MPLGFFQVAGFMVRRCLAVMVRCRLVLEGGVTVVVSRQPSLAADLRHMLSVTAHDFTPPAAGFPGFLAVELVGRAPFVSHLTAPAARLPGFLAVELVGRASLMGRTPPPTGDRALLLGIHGGKATPSIADHVFDPFRDRRFH
jgi:hypothetical protein